MTWLASMGKSRSFFSSYLSSGSATAPYFAVFHSLFLSRHFPFVILSHPILSSQQIFQQSFHHSLCLGYFFVLGKESKEAGSEDDLCPFLSVSHFLITDKEVAFLYTKEVAMRRIRAPQVRWRIYTQSGLLLYINDERAVHLAGCAALCVFSQP